MNRDGYIEQIASSTKETKAAARSLEIEWESDPVPVTILAAAIADTIIEHFHDISERSLLRIFDLVTQAIDTGNREDIDAVCTGVFRRVFGKIVEW